MVSEESITRIARFLIRVTQERGAFAEGSSPKLGMASCWEKQFEDHRQDAHGLRNGVAETVQGPYPSTAKLKSVNSMPRYPWLYTPNPHQQSRCAPNHYSTLRQPPVTEPSVPSATAALSFNIIPRSRQLIPDEMKEQRHGTSPTVLLRDGHGKCQNVTRWLKAKPFKLKSS
jgi:hypothetical protein